MNNTIEDEQFVRFGSRDGCAVRHPSAYCCTTIDAGTLFGLTSPAMASVFAAPTAEKRLRFGHPLSQDYVRFLRLHGLDGTRAIGFRCPELGMEDGPSVYLDVHSRHFILRTADGSPLSLHLPSEGDLSLVVQTPCREYDWATRKCKIYDTRPRICRDFPVMPQQVENTPCAYRFVKVDEAGRPVDH